jgi:hypothetical protein
MDKQQAKGHEKTNSACQHRPNHEKPEDADGSPTNDFEKRFCASPHARLLRMFTRFRLSSKASWERGNQMQTGKQPLVRDRRLPGNEYVGAR